MSTDPVAPTPSVERVELPGGCFIAFHQDGHSAGFYLPNGTTIARTAQSNARDFAAALSSSPAGGGAVPASRPNPEGMWIRCKVLSDDQNEPGHVLINICDGTYDGTVVSAHKDLLREDLAPVDRINRYIVAASGPTPAPDAAAGGADDDEPDLPPAGVAGLVDVFDEAAQDHGWQSDQGSERGAARAKAIWEAARVKLDQAITTLCVENSRLRLEIAALRRPETPPAGPFGLTQRVRKIKGSSWQGRVVGTYSTSLTPIGYAVESEREPGSVQIYPASALELVPLSEAHEAPPAGDAAMREAAPRVAADYPSRLVAKSLGDLAAEMNSDTGRADR